MPSPDTTEPFISAYGPRWETRTLALAQPLLTVGRRVTSHVRRDR